MITGDKLKIGRFSFYSIAGVDPDVSSWYYYP